MTERVAIVGSREHPNLGIVRAYVRSLPAGTVVISGGAAGVDKTAEMTAQAHATHWEVFGPECAVWAIDSASSGSDACPSGRLRQRDRYMLRNAMIVAACDRLVAFPDGSKGGTIRTLELCKIFRRPYEVREIFGDRVRVSRYGPTGRVLGMDFEDLPR